MTWKLFRKTGDDATHIGIKACESTSSNLRQGQGSVPSRAIQWEASSLKITDRGQRSVSSARIGLLLINSRVMPSSKQLAKPDFNFGALGLMEMRNPQADKKDAILNT